MTTLNKEKLQQWYKITNQLEELKVTELQLRKELFQAAFPHPTEGAADNKLDLGEGFILQGDYKINRTVDEAVVSALAKGDNTALLVAKLINYKPALVLKEWKALDDADRILVADMVTEKPGTPALKITKPKR